MSGDDENKISGRLLSFPRMFLPDSFDAPGSTPGPNGSGSGEDSGPPVPGAWPSLPHVSDMAPPLALTMPGIPDAGPDNSGGDEEGAFVPPQPEDPNHPTVRDTLAVAMALMTALGVAAVKGMWARVQHRQAVADQARANADKAVQKAAVSRGGPKGTTGAEGSLLRSLGSSGKKTRRSGDGKHRPPRDAHSGSHKGPGRGEKAPKAAPGGKAAGKDRGKKRRKGGPDWLKRRPTAGKSGKSPKQSNTKRGKGGAATPKRPGKLTWKAPKRGRDKSDRKRPKGWTSGRPKGAGKGTPKRKGPGKTRTGKLTWKASKRRPGGGKTTASRKRWAARGKLKPVVKRRKKSWSRRARKGSAAWLKRGRRWSTKRTETSTSGSRSSATTAPPPPPPPGFGRMRPPPGADRRTWATVDSVNVHRRPRPPKAKHAVLAAGTLALPPATEPEPGPEPSSAPETGQQPPPKTDNDVKTGVPVAVPVPRLAGAAIPLHGAQFRDGELTIRDVTEAGEEMAEEILAGADTAQRSAAMCETLAARLETLHAELCELQVPGILIPNVAVLLDKAQDVRGKALAIAEGLPFASEAMKVASANAAVRHQPTADMTRDMGHIKPAERPYHEE